MTTARTDTQRRVRDGQPTHYVGVAGVAGWLGVEPVTVTKWLTRYDDTPEPDAYIPPGRNGTPDRGWLPERRSDWEAWQRSRPGQGAPGRPKPHLAGASRPSAAPAVVDDLPAVPERAEGGRHLAAAHRPGQEEAEAPASKPPGRPRRRINFAEVADAVDELWSEGGLDNVSVAAVGDRLSVSRATLYRTISTQDQLLTIYFEQRSQENVEAALAVMDSSSDPAERLYGMIHLAIDSCVRSRNRSSLFYVVAGLPSKKYLADRHRWEQAWVEVTADAIHAGLIYGEDPEIVSRMIMAMCISAAYWWGPTANGATSQLITAEAIRLLTGVSERSIDGLASVGPRARGRAGTVSSAAGRSRSGGAGISS